MTTRKQDIAKMGILADQVRKHCKSKEVQCLIFSEGEEENTNTIAGYFSDKLVIAMVHHLLVWKPDVVYSAIQSMEKAIAEIENESKDTKPLIIEP